MWLLQPLRGGSQESPVLHEQLQRVGRVFGRGRPRASVRRARQLRGAHREARVLGRRMDGPGRRRLVRPPGTAQGRRRAQGRRESGGLRADDERAFLLLQRSVAGFTDAPAERKILRKNVARVPPDDALVRRVLGADAGVQPLRGPAPLPAALPEHRPSSSGPPTCPSVGTGATTMTTPRLLRSRVFSSGRTRRR